jgi:hypothetical protein
MGPDAATWLGLETKQTTNFQGWYLLLKQRYLLTGKTVLKNCYWITKNQLQFCWVHSRTWKLQLLFNISASTIFISLEFSSRKEK